MHNVKRRDFIKSGFIFSSVALYPLHEPRKITPQNTIRIRKDVGDLAEDDPILQTYAKAVDILKKLPINDFRRWENLAKVHVDFCPHGNWFFLPWHRAYLLMLENIIREVTNTPEFTLPYWDWTKDTQIPTPFWKGTLNDMTRLVTQNDTISTESTGQPVIGDVMKEKKFELFGSTKPINQTSTDTKFQRSRGAMSLLERTPHNDVHNWINGNMGDMVSPLDPIFWLHHCNIDRIWADWNSKGNANTGDRLWRDFTFKQNFVSSKDKRYDVIVSNLEDTIALGYRYPGVNPASDPPLSLASTPFLETNFVEKFSSIRATSSKLGQESVFPVELSEKAANQAKSIRTEFVEKREQPRVMAIVKNVDPGAATNIRVRVFLDCNYLSETTPPNDPHYVGSLSFLVLIISIIPEDITVWVRR
jgi:tyrosinase